MSTKYWAILPAAGSGSRFASVLPKQYLPLLDKTVMQHSVDRICQLALAGCVVAIAAHDQTANSLQFAEPQLLHWVNGGQERMDSVLSALNYLRPIAAEHDWILVHDVARPCILLNDLQRLLAELKADPVGGVLAVPVRDTLKLAQQQQVIKTISRANLWQCQTPQMFRFGHLLRALESAQQNGQVVTDEASAIELLDLPVQLVSGSSSNIKITYPDDLGLATAILQSQLDSNYS
ncbi:2-C-methyl-D-erythritol 4-phosphate cytidylyltransferase [Alkanindiges sp. WGS2144]|uniref:2-C-methyl-D-erythritol 4-phosphate cytidylyltransferase n=1 Tax=Alkanindiges sp. WGS2144 TaxID=3366808 RepID=UPI003752736E